MSQAHAVTFRADLHVLIDGVEPILNALEILNGPPLRDKVLAIYANTLLFRLLVEQVHVGDENVRAVVARDTIALGPKLLGVRADLRQKRVFLHGPG